MSEITPDALSARLETDEELFVLDIRNEDDYEDWHIPGSTNIPVYDELKQRAGCERANRGDDNTE